MTEDLKKYQDLVNGLMQKLDEERQKSSRLESELAQYREGKSATQQLAAKDKIIEKQYTISGNRRLFAAFRRICPSICNSRRLYLRLVTDGLSINMVSAAG